LSVAFARDSTPPGRTGRAVTGSRNQLGAVLAVVAYAFLVDAIVFAAVPSVGRFLPGKAGDALAGRPVDHLVGPSAGGAVLVAWTVALVALAAVRSDRSDV